jgi:hypothetical protein
MGITHANTELVARAYLKTITGLPTNQIGTTLPQKISTWASTGYIQLIVIYGTKGNIYYGYRRPVITIHCWAINPNGQNPPWGKACDLAEIIYAKLLETGNGIENLSLGVAGAPDVRVLQAWEVSEPKRVPWGFPSGEGSFVDPGNMAHYTMDIQIAWCELPAS